MGDILFDDFYYWLGDLVFKSESGKQTVMLKDRKRVLENGIKVNAASVKTLLWKQVLLEKNHFIY